MSQKALQVENWLREQIANVGFEPDIKFETVEGMDDYPIYYITATYVKDEEPIELSLSVHKDRLILGTLNTDTGSRDLEEGPLNRGTVEWIVDDFLNCIGI